MADVTDVPAADRRARLLRAALAALLVGVLVAVALARVVLIGWGPVAPDDARYLNVGLSVLAGKGAVTPDGNLFLLRSPVYGVALAGGAALLGGDPLDGARVVALALMLVALVGAVRLGWLLGGPIGAAGTTVAILATPLLWRLVSTPRIDLVQGAGVVGVILALSRPTVQRAALGGLIFGLTLLVKETAVLLALLPLAWLGFVPPRRVLTLAAVYAGVAILVAGWWWLYVWLQAGVLFPLNALRVVQQREVAGSLQLGRPSQVIVALLVVAMLGTGAVGLLRRLRADPRARLLAIAGLSMLAPALYATAKGLSARNYAVLALLCAVAVGATVADAAPAVRRLLGRRPRPARLAAAGGALLLASALVLVGQRASGAATGSTLPDELSSWLGDAAAPGERVVMTFRLRERIALELHDRVQVSSLSAVRVRAEDDPRAYVWMGLRDRQLFGYPATGWERTLGQPDTTFLVLVGPHPLTPSELVPFLTSSTGTEAGITVVTTMAVRGDTARVFAVDAGRVPGSAARLGLHLSPAAAEAWLSLGPLPGERLARLALARPVVVGGAAPMERLRATVGAGACLTPAGGAEPAGSLVLGPCG